MIKSQKYLIINLILLTFFIPLTKLSNPKSNAIWSESRKNPLATENKNYIVMTFMEDIGYQNFFEYEDIDKCFKNNDYNNYFDFYNPCSIEKKDKIEFTFKKEFKNLDSFLSNNKSQQVEYLLSVDLSGMIPMIKDITSMNYMFKGCKNLKYINFGNFDASKVTSMISMFEGCSSLISINLSSFNTSNVIDMSDLFNNLISLKVLDISNFNMENVIKHDNMFNNISKLRYINIYNLKNEINKIVNNAFKDNNDLIVCQKEKIISNPNAIHKCCDFNIEKDNCDILSTTQINSSSLYKLNSEKVNDIKLTIEKSNKSKKRRIQDTEKMGIIILGFGFCGFNETKVLIDYFFVTTNNDISFTYLNFSAYVDYNDSETGVISRQTKDVSCTFENNQINNKYKIPCSTQVDNTSFVSIGGQHEFKYDPDNYEVKGITPLVHMYENVSKIVNLLNSNDQRVYIFEHTSCLTNTSEFRYFNLSGTINDNTINISYTNLTFYANYLNGGETVVHYICSVFDENSNDNYYTLLCENYEYTNLDLQSSVAFINDNDDILLINFDQSVICTDPNVIESTIADSTIHDSTINNITSGVTVGVSYSDTNNIPHIDTDKVLVRTTYTITDSTNIDTDKVLVRTTNRIMGSTNAINKCSGPDFFLGVCNPEIIPNSTDIVKSDYIYDILDDIENGEFNDIFDKAITENKTYNGTENNITYTISTVSSQYNTNYSTVALEECESLLKEKYSLDKNEDLILLKLEYGIEEFKIPVIEYQLFLKNGTKINLSQCDDIPQIVSIPVDINEKEEFIHNPNSNFYDDECYAYTTEYDTDLTMYDRKNNYNENYLSLCEKNCEYIGYNSENKRAQCECKTKTIFPELAEKKEKNKKSNLNLKDLIHQFGDVIKHWNLFLFKCYKQVFSSEGLKKNSASYVNFSIIFIFILCTIFFIVSGYALYLNRIKDFANKKFDNNNLNETNKDLKVKDITNPNDISNINNTNVINIKNNMKNPNLTSSSESQINNAGYTKPFNDFEMNNLKYEHAVKIDKRTFCQMYMSFIRTKQPICFTFFLCNDYNSRIIKISLFLFSFSLEYAVNALFFHDKTMHKIYEDRGDYNFVYQLPQIIYSFIISFAITKFISVFILSEKKISKVIEIKNPETENKINDLFRNSIYKMVIFFILVFLFHLLFLYYLAAFCAVYKNTQGALIKDTMISFAISLLIYSYIICLIPCIMRYCSLNMKNRYNSCVYKASDIISDIFL